MKERKRERKEKREIVLIRMKKSRIEKKERSQKWKAEYKMEPRTKRRM